MSKKEERDNFWISVGPESGYLGTIAEETARKNDGGISPDGERLGWNQNQAQNHTPRTNSDGKHDATDYPFGDPCDIGLVPMPGMEPIYDQGAVIPIPDLGPEHQNTEE